MEKGDLTDEKDTGGLILVFYEAARKKIYIYREI